MRAAERRSARKIRSGKYVDPALKPAKRGRPRKDGEERPKKRTRGADAAADTDNLNVDRSSLRKSTKAASSRAADEREKRELDDEQRRMKKALRDANKPEVRKLTQKELLEEAAETEISNREDLKNLLRLEEERKRLPPPKVKQTGPCISVRSRDGKQTVSISDPNLDARAVLFPHIPPDT